MQLNLTGKSFEITPAIKTLVEDKLEHLDSHFANITNVHVVLHIEHLDHIAEATLHFHGNELHATAKTSDMYTSIDQLFEKLSTQVNKHKEKVIDAHRHSS